MKHNFKEWLVATRYWSFPVSTMPVVVTLAYLSSYKLIQWDFRAVILAVMVLTGMLALHTAGNLLSDYFDYKKGVDNENAFSVPNLVFHKFEPKEYFVAGSIFALAGSALGILISLICGWEILLIGIVGVALTLLYSPLKFNALGDLNIFLNFSILPILGTSYVMTGGFVWSAAILALPLGVITVSVLHANNTRDKDFCNAFGRQGVRKALHRIYDYTFPLHCGGNRGRASPSERSYKPVCFSKGFREHKGGFEVQGKRN